MELQNIHKNIDSPKIDHKILNYKRTVLFFDILYKSLNSQFSKAYLSGSLWYIGDSLINNSKFIYPPNELLIMWGICRKKDIIKSRFILYTLLMYFNKNLHLKI